MDLTDDLFDTCRRRAAEAGVTVTCAAANPEELPFPSHHFDRVLSAVGGSLALAPNQLRVAAEMARVCGPGGMLAVANWTAEGLAGQAARVIASHLPPPPPDAPSPWAWADEDSVRALLAPFGYALTLARRMASFSYSSPDVGAAPGGRSGADSLMAVSRPSRTAATASRWLSREPTENA